MITDITLVYDNQNDKDIIDDTYFPTPIFMEFIDKGGKKSKKKAREIMEDWGARKLPFAIIKDKDTVIKCLYSEACNVINNLKDIIENGIGY